MLLFQFKTICVLLAFSMLFQKQNNRLMLIFVDNADSHALGIQSKILNADPNGIKYRDLLIKTIVWNDASRAEYQKWHVGSSPFTVLLIGKDGGEKMRSHQPVTLAKLYDLIDHMPMMQQVKYKNQ